MKFYLYYSTEHPTLHFAGLELSSLLEAIDSSFTFFHNPDHMVKKEEDSLSIHLKVEGTNHSSVDDSYHICIQEHSGSIIGCNERSVLLGVYSYLRRLGIRFLLPGKHGTYFPTDFKEEALFQSYDETAPLRHRGVCIEGADSLENIVDFIDWLPKIGFNSFFLQFKEPYVFLNRWYAHVGNPLQESPALDDAFYQGCYAKIIEEVYKRSLLYHAVGHGWTSEAMGYPSIGWEAADQKPDAFTSSLLAEVNGVRDFIACIPSNTNLCYSNPEAIARFCKTVITYIEEHPHVDYLHIWLADEANHICECEKCRKSTPSDQYIHILNEIDAEMTRKGMQCKLVFLLYQELLYPPVHETLNNPDRFTLMFAPISRTFNESYPDKITEVPLPEYERNHMKLPINIAENLTYLKKWQDIFKGDGFVYDYPLGRAHYGDHGYVHISKILAGDIKNIAALNLNGYISCQELRALLPNGLPNYVMGHLLADTTITFEAITAEYYSAAYGTEYPLALSYLSKVSELSNSDYFNGKGPRISPEIHAQYQVLHGYFMEQHPHIRESIEQIRHTQGKNQELQLFFWTLLDYHASCGVQLTEALIALSCGEQASADALFADFCKFIQENENQFQPYLDVYRIIEVASKYTGFHSTLIKK